MEFALIMGIGTVVAILIVASLPKSSAPGDEENTFETSPPRETPPWRKDISEVFSSDDYDYLRKLARYQKDPQHWPCPFPPDLPRKTEYD